MKDWRSYRSVPEVDRNTQGMIYFHCQNYRKLSTREKNVIDELCVKTGNGYGAAVHEYMTTAASRTKICKQYYISEATLNRAVRRFIQEFPKFSTENQNANKERLKRHE